MIATAAVAAAAIAVFVLAQNQRVMRFFRREVVISIAGDVLLDRGVASFIEQYGMDYPYAGVSELFLGDDLTVANLECPLTHAEAAAMKASQFVFKADPENAKALKIAGFDMLVLANNHTMDYLSAGLLDTMDALDGAGVLPTGAGNSQNEIEPCFTEINGVKIGVLSYSSLPVEGFMHDGSGATIAYARAGFLDAMQLEVSKAAVKCDFLIVYFHWGTEYRHDVTASQIEIAHAAVDFGASFVVGAHPHVLQGVELYSSVPIYYSIGNFVFDKQIPDGTDEAVILQLTIDRNGIVAIEEIPVVITNCQPGIAGSEKAEEILSSLARYSRNFE